MFCGCENRAECAGQWKFNFDHKIPQDPRVTFDIMFKSSQATAICNKIISRNKVPRGLAGSTWGEDKETLLNS